MGTVPERPLTDDHAKKVIGRAHMHETKYLLEIRHPTYGYLCDLYWVGKSSVTFQDAYQPGIFCPASIEDRYLSYEGKVNYVFSGANNAYAYVRYPFDSSVYRMSPDSMHFFTAENPLVPNYQYALKQNNTSFVMNNISVFNEDYKYGCMINLRASFEGLLVGNNIDGNVVILVSVDPVSAEDG